MILKHITRIPPDQAQEIIAGSVRSLKADWELNIANGTFKKFPGRDLTFEEFVLMLLIDKDFTLAAAGLRNHF